MATDGWMDGRIDEWSDGQTDGWMDLTRMKARLQQGWWSSRVLSIGKQTVRSSQWRPAQWCEKIINIIVVILIIIIVLSCSWEEVWSKHNRRSLRVTPRRRLRLFLKADSVITKSWTLTSRSTGFTIWIKTKRKEKKWKQLTEVGENFTRFSSTTSNIFDEKRRTKRKYGWFHFLRHLC